MNSRQDLALLILECENHSIFTGHGEMLFARGGVNGFVGDGSRVGEWEQSMAMKRRVTWRQPSENRIRFYGVSEKKEEQRELRMIVKSTISWSITQL